MLLLLFALKLLRIKDQWCTVLVKCQFVCNRDLSLLTSMPFDRTSSGGKCYSAGRRQLSPGSFQKGSENWEKTSMETVKFFKAQWKNSIKFHEKKFKNLNGTPWNFMKEKKTPWNSMSQTQTEFQFHGVPWNSMEFHGIPRGYFTHKRSP